MKVCIITTEDPFYTSKIMNELIKNKSISIELVIMHNGFINIKRIYSTFFIYGFIKFIKTVISVIYNSIKGGIVKNLFVKSKIEVLETNNINSADVIDKLKSKEIDIIISNNCPQRIKNKVLETSKIASINVHLGLLPNYRGLFPLFHAFIRDEKYVGVSIHYMNILFDDGIILSQKKIKIDSNDDLFNLYEKAFDSVPKLIENAIHKIMNLDKKQLIQNKKSESSYFSYPNFKEITLYHKKSKKNKQARNF